MIIGIKLWENTGINDDDYISVTDIARFLNNDDPDILFITG